MKYRSELYVELGSIYSIVLNSPQSKVVPQPKFDDQGRQLVYLYHESFPIFVGKRKITRPTAEITTYRYDKENIKWMSYQPSKSFLTSDRLRKPDQILTHWGAILTGIITSLCLLISIRRR